MSRYLIFDHVFADVVGDEAVGVFFLDETIEAGDEERVVSQFYFSHKLPEMITLGFHLSLMWTLPCSILQGIDPEE
jgi:hypothetical protein